MKALSIINAKFYKNFVESYICHVIIQMKRGTTRWVASESTLKATLGLQTEGSFYFLRFSTYAKIDMINPTISMIVWMSKSTKIIIISSSNLWLTNETNLLPIHGHIRGFIVPLKTIRDNYLFIELFQTNPIIFWIKKIWND